MMRISVVEDHRVFAELLTRYIRATRDLHLSSLSTTGEQAIDDIVRHKPDVVLMDINLPSMDGIECIRQLRLLTPPVLSPILILTEHDESRWVFEALQAGAIGYLLKDHIRTKEICAAARDAIAGGGIMSPRIARQVMAYFASPPIPSFEKLSSREHQVLQHLADGLLYKEIADKLGTKIDTVRTQITSIYRKLHVHTRADAVRQYLRQKSFLPYHMKM